MRKEFKDEVVNILRDINNFHITKKIANFIETQEGEGINVQPGVVLKNNSRNYVDDFSIAIPNETPVKKALIFSANLLDESVKGFITEKRFHAKFKYGNVSFKILIEYQETIEVFIYDEVNMEGIVL